MFLNENNFFDSIDKIREKVNICLEYCKLLHPDVKLYLPRVISNAES